MLLTQEIKRRLGHTTHISLCGQLHQGYVYIGYIFIRLLFAENQNEYRRRTKTVQKSSLLICRVVNYVVLRLLAGTDAVTGLAF